MMSWNFQVPTWLLAALLAGSAGLAPAAADPADSGKGSPAENAATVVRRVAVKDFQIGGVSQWWEADWDVGRGIAEMLVAGLVQDGTYSVVERRQLEEVLGERELSSEESLDPEEEPRMGRLPGADALITGTVTRFDLEDRRARVGFSGGFGGFGLGGGKSKTRATVVVNARIIDVATGTVVAAASGKGESGRGSLKISGRAGGIGTNFAFGSAEFEDTIIGEATRKCVEELCRELVKAASKVRPAPRRIEGLVAEVAGSTLIVNAGTGEGLRPGDVLRIERVVRTVEDPATGRPLRIVTELLGTLRVTDVDDRSASGTFQAAPGRPEPRVSDLARLG